MREPIELIGPRKSGDSAMQGATKPAAKHADIKDMSFERALKELEHIVGRLERGDVELEESIAIYERGESLKEHCDRLLKQAEAKVEKLTLNRNGEPTGSEPFKNE
jgi:exodeoxyribonuclease VII small subunit